MGEPPGFDAVTLPDIMYQPASALRDLQNRLVAAIVTLCYRGHPYYRRVMLDQGLTPDDIQGVDDLILLPITTKQAFMSDPEAFRLQLDDLSVEERTLREVMYTTGTTSGRPTPIYTTTWDYYSYVYHSRRYNEFIGIHAADVIAHLFPLTPAPMGGYIRAFAWAAATGCSIFTPHTGRPFPSFPVHNSLDDAVRLVSLHRATVLYGQPSFIRRLLIRAEEAHADLAAVRIVMVTGEASSQSMRDDLADRLRRLGATNPSIINRYGATEGLPLAECHPGAGWHNPSPDQLFQEVVDPATGVRLGNGEKGLLLISNLIRRGTVLLRYAVGDLVALTDEPCPRCGRTTERVITQPTRTKDIIKIKGTLVNLDALVNDLESLPGVDEFQIVVRLLDPADPFSPDELLIRIATEDPAIGGQVMARTSDATMITPRLEFVARDAIFDPLISTKAVRVRDERNLSMIVRHEI